MLQFLPPPAKRIQITAYEHHLAKERSLWVLNERHLGREKPVMGYIEPLLRTAKLVE